ncbi:MAG: DedA family protein [Acidobacteriota bacterium]
METLFVWITQYGYFAIFILLLLGIVGLPFPDEWLLTFTGYLIFKQNLSLWPAFIVAATGSMCGITVSYGLGRSAGLFIVHRYGRLFRISQKDLDRVHGWFGRFGKWMLLVGYFIPGVRHLTAIVAGASKMEYRHFALFAYTGALIWATVFIWIGYSVGERWTSVMHQVERHSTLCAWIIFAVLVAYILRRCWKRKGSKTV